MNHAELMQAIHDRHAVHRFLDRSIPAEIRTELDQAIERCNQESGLSMRAMYDEPEGFSGGITSYGMFRNVRNYLILAGVAQDELATTCGYWGQQIVLLAQHLGLNSCWAALTFNQKRVKAELTGDQKLVLVVALGYGEHPGKPHKTKPIEKLGRVAGGGAMPDWFRRGVEMAGLAPTALNQLRFSFELDGDTVTAHQGVGPYTAVDLGIAKYHFEVGASGATWHWASSFLGGCASMPSK